MPVKDCQDNGKPKLKWGDNDLLPKGHPKNK
jgi:hypothetical protein